MDATSSSPGVMSGGVEKPATDDRSYRFVQLENGMKVVLVSDPTTDSSGAAVCVGVGHFSDPAEFPGLAHMLEHALFMGTEKYPVENEYSAFLTSHGGYSNAYTQTEATNYHFEVQSPFFEEALDRFAQFFVGPLFAQDSLAREVKAVDAEHSKNTQSDMWRFYQLDKSTSNPEYPYHKFGTGNAETLWTKPKSEGLDTREAFLKFYDQYYSANQMSLSIVAREDLDTLEAWVKERFSSVRTNGRDKLSFPGSPYTDAHVGIRQYVVPKKDASQIDVAWLLPEQYSNYTKRPCSYLSHLFGHEGKGSILSHLKAKGLALELSAGTMTSESGFSIFGVTVDIPPEAVDSADEILDVIFQYTRMLQTEGPKEWIYEECRDIANASFRFAGKSGVVNYATRIAGNLQHYPSEHVLSGPSLYREYAPDEIRAATDAMTPNKARIRISSPSLAGKCTQSETWYGTAYLQEAVPDELIKRWSTSAIDPALHLPPPNPFIATDFSLFTPKVDHPVEPDLGDIDFSDATTRTKLMDAARRLSLAPETIRDDDNALAFFLSDDRFGKPRANASFWLSIPAAYESPRSTVLTDLYTQLFKDQLNELAYDASVASLDYSFNNTTTGLEVHIGGFNHKLTVLAEHIVSAMPTLTFSDEKFEIYRAKTERRYRNFAMEQPYSHAILNLTCMLTAPRYHNDAKIGPIQSVTAGELREFIPRIMSEVFVRAVVYGNTNAESATALVAAVERPFRASSHGAIGVDRRFLNRAVRLPYGMELRHTQAAPNPENPNAAIEVVFQIGPHSPQQSVCVDVLAQVINEPFFNILRTKMALGYLAFSGVRSDLGVESIRLLFQSDKVTCEELDRRIESFLFTFRSLLADMPEEDFHTNVSAVLREKLAAPKSRANVMTRLKSVIADWSLDFDGKIKSVAALMDVSKVDILAFFDDYLARGGLKRRKLVGMVAAGTGAASGAVEAAPVTDGEESKDDDSTPKASYSASGPDVKTLPQDSGVLIASKIGGAPATSSSALRRETLEAFAEFDIPKASVTEAFVPVAVDDIASFRATLPMYPTQAVGLMRWRRSSRL